MNVNTSQLMAREAAEQSGKSHRQIQRLIKNGTLSATRDKSGNYLIEKSEFYRVFPEAFNIRRDATSVVNTSQDCRDNKINLLEAMLSEKTRHNEFLQKQLEFIGSQLESSTLEKTRLLDTIGNQQRLIEHQSGKKKRKKLFGLF
jgi:predicted site-specific integrase-resolvase